jgi:hypothetical protein
MNWVVNGLTSQTRQLPCVSEIEQRSDVYETSVLVCEPQKSELTEPSYWTKEALNSSSFQLPVRGEYRACRHRSSESTRTFKWHVPWFLSEQNKRHDVPRALDYFKCRSWLSSASWPSHITFQFDFMLDYVVVLETRFLSACPVFRMLQLENCWPYSDEIW